MAEQVPVTQARAQLSDLVNRVAYAGDRIELTRHGKVVAALVSAEDYNQLQHDAPPRRLGFVPPDEPAPAGPLPLMPAAAQDPAPSSDRTGSTQPQP